MKGRWAAVRRGLLVTAAMAVLAIVTATGPAASARTTAALAKGAAQAPQVVLVNQPPGSICTGGRITVGVWFQQMSGGSRAYRVGVSGPRHRRFFYRHGVAPTSHWKFWKVLAGRTGKYVTTYASHRPGSSKWTIYHAYTRAHRCAGTRR